MTKRAYSPNEVLSIKSRVFEFQGAWRDAFGTPERAGVWFIWGESGSGKTSFAAQLCLQLASFERVLYNNMEEGVSLSMQNTIRRFGLADRKGAIQFLDSESIEQLSERLSKRRSARIVIIDSFQYTQLRYKDYIAFKEQHRDKLIIFISHASGNMPAGRSAVSVRYDATLKIWVHGYRAFSKGRFIGPLGYFDVWPEKAVAYWNGQTKLQN